MFTNWMPWSAWRTSFNVGQHIAEVDVMSERETHKVKLLKGNMPTLAQLDEAIRRCARHNPYFSVDDSARPTITEQTSSTMVIRYA